MSRKFIAAIVALSLTVSGVTASQAQASDKRTRNLVLGIATLAIVGAAIANKNRDDRKSHIGRSNTHTNKKPNHSIKPRPLPPRAQLNQLPQRCLRSFPTRDGGTLQMYGARCMKRHYAYADRLPRACRQSIWTRQGTQNGYSPRCLRSHQRNAQTAWPNRRATRR